TRDALGVTVEILDTAGRRTQEHLATADVDPNASHGFGLWVIQQLCDSVALECTGLGSRLRLRMLVPAAGSYGDHKGGALTGGAYPWS
ncbi:MAG: hypothetical protein HOV97_21915, partial [Nonomuraea sp.]|nr:hypothetical protein [Nonomuraea sp.]